MHYYRGENSCSCNFGKVNVPHLQHPVCGMTAVKETSLVSFFHFRVYVASVLDMILSVTVSQILHVTLLLYKQLPDGNTEKIHLMSVT